MELRPCLDIPCLPNIYDKNYNIYIYILCFITKAPQTKLDRKNPGSFTGMHHIDLSSHDGLRPAVAASCTYLSIDAKPWLATRATGVHSFVMTCPFLTIEIVLIKNGNCFVFGLQHDCAIRHLKPRAAIDPHVWPQVLVRQWITPRTWRHFVFSTYVPSN